jgi:hypothetical protein
MENFIQPTHIYPSSEMNRGENQTNKTSWKEREIK